MRSAPLLRAAAICLLLGLQVQAQPVVSSLTPGTVDAGCASRYVTVTGNGFQVDSVASLAGRNLVTLFIDPTTLMVWVEGSLVAESGTPSLTVTNPPASVSNAVALAVMPAGAPAAPAANGHVIVAGATECQPFDLTTTPGVWNAVAVSSLTDWSLRRGAHESHHGADHCDYLLADPNVDLANDAGAIAHESGSDDALLQHAASVPLSLGVPLPVAMSATEVLKVVHFDVPTNSRLSFQVTGASSLRWEVFQSPSAGWAHRGSGVLDGVVGAPAATGDLRGGSAALVISRDAWTAGATAEALTVDISVQQSLSLVPVRSSFIASGPGGTVPSSGSASFHLATPGGPILEDLDLELHIGHAAVGELDVYLHFMPSEGSPPVPWPGVLLIDHRGGTGADFRGTRLDDAAPTSITTITAPMAPFAGDFAPENPLTAFNGVKMSGVWSLTVADDVPGNSARVERWSLRVNMPATNKVRTGSLPITSGTSAVQMGEAFCGVGDLNGDGAADFAVGAPSHGLVGLVAERAGSVTVVSGLDGATIHRIDSTEPAGDGFGAAVARIDDLNGDGLSEIAIGSPGDQSTGIPGGRVIVVSGADASIIHDILGTGLQ